MYVEAAGQPQQQEVALPLERTPARWVGRILWLEAAVLLAVVQVLFAGYRMGVGNQTIQIPFLKQWATVQRTILRLALPGGRPRPKPGPFRRDSENGDGAWHPDVAERRRRGAAASGPELPVDGVRVAMPEQP